MNPQDALNTIQQVDALAAAAGTIQTTDAAHISAGVDVARQLVSGGHVTPQNAFAALLVALERGLLHF